MELCDDDIYSDWTKKWKRIKENERLSHMQKLFRMFLTKDGQTYYSFCNQDLADDDCDWHCDICKQCQDWRVWHCDRCNQCMFNTKLSRFDFLFFFGSYGQSLPCERCGETDDDYDSDNEDEDEDNDDYSFFRFY